MRKLISEQSVTALGRDLKTLSNQNQGGKAANFNTSYIVGKTMNVYSASPNTNQNFIGTIRINNAAPLGSNGLKIRIGVTDQNRKSDEIIKTCGKKVMESSNAVGGNNRFLYSDNFNGLLEGIFCTRSRSGSVVPSADFASNTPANDASTASQMAEGKRVVRLTEADLVRLVKKVLNS
jgi:hypothetical protein